MTTAVTGKRRYGHLDGLRGVAAVNVMLSHALVAFDFALFNGVPAMSHGSWDVALSAWPFLLPAAGANLSVCVFFVLSGFVLAHAFAHSDLGMLAQGMKRMVRLGVPILVTAVLSWGLLRSGFMANHEAAALTRSAWLDNQMSQEPALLSALAEGALALFQSVPFAQTYDSSLWTMPVEFAGSVILIVAEAVSRHVRVAQGGRAAGVLALLGLAVVLNASFVCLIVCGAAMYVTRAGRPARVHGGVAAGAVVLALLLGTVPYSDARGAVWDAFIRWAPQAAWQWPWSGLTGFAAMDPVSVWHGVGAILLVLAVDSSAWLSAWLSGGVARFLGRISFPLYLLHVPLLLSVGCWTFLAFLHAGVPYGGAAILATIVYAAVALAAATIAARFIEAPAIALAARTGAAVQWAASRRRAVAARL